MLGLDDETIRDAFDPPLPAGAVAAAWREYRANPGRVARATPLQPAGR